ncbi:hypothetical protein WCD74_03120 [Actinomycetospora sp. OC33-EN08]|uniref:Antitoxin n=1 Tax=Actinomycetospora aurantiaca TaxID=3129233 RepID=A0ABU8MJW6_9PSEU
MRTTLSIDDDVMIVVRERAAREKRAVGEVLSELVRTALSVQVRDRPNVEASRHGLRPLPRRGPVVTNALVDELRDPKGPRRRRRSGTSFRSADHSSMEASQRQAEAT